MNELEKRANTIRQDIIRMVAEAGSGHPGGSLGMADIFTYLYSEHLNHDPEHPEWKERDYLFLSNGHISPVLYATLARHGYFPVEELNTFRKINSRLQGHPHNGALPGVENSGGPLGQGISQAVGAAWALKQEGKRNNVYALTGDGELNEGQVWEAALFAQSHNLSNYVQIIDRNYIQIDGDTVDVNPLEPLKAKYQAFNHCVIEIDGHNFNDIQHALDGADTQNRPTVIIAKTVPGKGVSYMEYNHEWHGKAPTVKQAEKALEELQ